MPKVSVIVPVYNVEKYLRRCVDSILSQTFTDFELILVNDGSKDDSGKICDEYVQKDSRIVVIHKENGGVSSARNKGIDAAQGECITFVDSDDYISEDFIENIYSSNCDFSICSIQCVGSSTKSLKFEMNEIITKEQIADWILNNSQEFSFIATPWAKIYKTDLIKRIGIKFNEKMRYGEDTDFVYRYLGNCNSIKLTNDAVYYYFDTDAIHQSSKYKFGAKDFCYHVKTINESIFYLEKVFRKKFIRLRKRIYLIYLIAFDTYISCSDINHATKELKTLRKNLIFDMSILRCHRKFCTFKEYIYFSLIIIFPFSYKYLKKMA